MEDLKQSIANSNLIYAAVRNFPNPVLQSEETTNDSDKTIVVPSNKIWEILWIWIEFSSTAVVGNRHILVEFLDPSDDIIYRSSYVTDHTASSSRQYIFSPSSNLNVVTLSLHYYTILPLKSFLPSGFKIHILDSGAIDSAADDMNIQMMVNEWDVS